MNDIDLMLIEKEKLYKIIEKDTCEFYVVTLKANIPGSIKNNNSSKILIDIFDKLIKAFNPIESYKFGSISGDTIIYHFPRTKNLKKNMVKLELGPIGRFVDIDFYINTNSIKRNKPRKCFLCDNEAFYCIRNKTHTIVELNNYIDSSIHDYLKKKITKYLDYSFLKELELNPKFGLVSKWSKGSHKDMNYQMMVKSKNVIVPYLTDMFDIGYYNDINSILKPIRIIGKVAEDEMLKATNGVNTYKGLIFSLGIVVASLGHYLSHYKEMPLYEVIKIVSEPIKEDFKNMDSDTIGLLAYKEYNFMGARGNAINGYKVCFDLIKNNKLKSKEDLYKAFFYFVNNVDDTVLLKRSGSLTKYKEVKEMFKEYKKDLIIPLTKYSIKNNLSFGGTADLMSVSLFLKKIIDELGINLEGSNK